MWPNLQQFDSVNKPRFFTELLLLLGLSGRWRQQALPKHWSPVTKLPIDTATYSRQL